MEINILGTKYRIEERCEQDDQRLLTLDGYCDSSAKICVVDSMEVGTDNERKQDTESYKRQVKRHEIIHAFLSESGLSTCSEWAVNEEMVDWWAIQFPKLAKAFAKADCINE